MSIAKGTFNIEFIHSKKELQRSYKHNYRHEGFYACNVDKDSSYLNEQLIGSWQKKMSFSEKLIIEQKKR